MSTSSFVISYTYTVNYVTSKILLELKEIIREIGLDPLKFSNDWKSNEHAISAWLRSGHLECVILEVYDPANSSLISRWDIDVVYNLGGDGSLWVDTDVIRYHINKAGLVPADCYYDIKLKTSQGRPDVQGWVPCSLRSTESFKRYSLGATVGGNEISAQTSYWSR